jgi:hypothetical protein
MILDHTSMLALVPRVNGPIALVSFPFALYEALSKKANVAELKVRIDLRADQLLALTVSYVEETLMPFWPRSITRIIIEPHVQFESTTALSEAARDALTNCLRKNSADYIKAVNIRLIPKKIHRFDRLLYWTIFCTAAFSACALVTYILSVDMTDAKAKVAIVGPGLLLLFSLGIAGARQSYIHLAKAGLLNESSFRK